MAMMSKPLAHIPRPPQSVGTGLPMRPSVLPQQHGHASGSMHATAVTRPPNSGHHLSRSALADDSAASTIVQVAVGTLRSANVSMKPPFGPTARMCGPPRPSAAAL